MIRNEIGLYNRWGRYAFRWRSYRAMMHSVSNLIKLGKYKNYADLKEFEKGLDWRFG
ncbi:MAG: hypothetical protein HGA35_05895 [Erysipelotrichaceae bacterium]|nr:hypothetical protein [Erysipelotrichaceae bacterium]